MYEEEITLRKLRYLIEYFMNIFLGPREYFDFISDIGGDRIEAVLLVIASGIFYGVLNSSRSLAVNGLGDYATINSLSGAIPVFASNFVSGYLFFGIIFTVLLVTGYLTAFLTGLKSFEKTFFAFSYASPGINVYIGFLLIYELFSKFVVGFPLIKYLLALVALIYIGYLSSRGIEAFHGTSWRKSILVGMIPVLLIILAQVALAVSVMYAMLSVI